MASRIQKPQSAAPVSYYPFGQRADRLVALAVGYDGTLQPMKRAAAAFPATPLSAWSDAGGAMSPTTIAAGSTALFAAKVADGNSALIAIEFSGWSLPYPPNIANILGPSWPFGQSELNYNPAASVGNVPCLKNIAFSFSPMVDAAGNKTAKLEWTTGSLPVIGDNSVSLDANNLKFAYVVLRVFGTNNSQITSPSQLGKDAAGNPIMTLAT